MVIAAAEVNPAMTGNEKKSMRNPRRRNPATRMTMPVKKVRRTADTPSDSGNSRYVQPFKSLKFQSIQEMSPPDEALLPAAPPDVPVPGQVRGVEEPRSDVVQQPLGHHLPRCQVSSVRL